jgi:hypothetical protein
VVFAWRRACGPPHRPVLVVVVVFAELLPKDSRFLPQEFSKEWMVEFVSTPSGAGEQAFFRQPAEVDSVVTGGEFFQADLLIRAVREIAEQLNFLFGHLCQISAEFLFF